MAVCDAYRRETGDGKLTVIASTASAYKFAPAVLRALTDAPLPENDFDKLELLSKLTGTPVPAPLNALRGAEPIHRACIAKEDMAQFILRELDAR